MFCSNCGGKLDDDALFCDNCGNRVEENNAQPTAANIPPVTASVQAAPVAAEIQQAPVNIQPVAAVVQSAPIDIQPVAAPVQTAPISVQPQPVITPPQYAAAPLDIVMDIPKPVEEQPFVHPYDPTQQPVTPNELPPIRNMQPTVPIPINQPVKPKKKGKVALIIIIAIVLALGIAFGVARLFFWDNVLRLVMGEKEYNKMIEEKSIAMLLPENEETADAVSNILKLTSGGVSTAMTSVNINAESSSVDDIIEDATQSNSAVAAVIPYLLKSFNPSSITELLGSDGAQISVSPSIELGSYTSSMLAASGENYADAANQLVEILNSIKYSYYFKADGENMLIGTELAAGDTLLANADVYKISNELYIAFPYFTDKSFVINLEENTYTEVSPEFTTLDSKEVDKLINDIIKSYTEYVSELGQTTSNGTYTAGGVTVSGTTIVTALTAGDIKNITANAFEILDKNEYFTNYIVNYMNTYALGFADKDEYTAEDYHEDNAKTISDILEPDDIDGEIVMNVKTVVSSNGDIIGKLFELVDYDGANAGEIICTLSILKNGGNKVYAIEINDDSKFGIYINVKEQSEGNGVVTLTLDLSSATASIDVEYKNIKKEKLGNIDTWSGSVTVKLGENNTMIDSLLTTEVRASVSDALAELGVTDFDIDKLLDNANISIESKINGDTCEAQALVNLSDFGKIGTICSIALNCNREIAIPTGAVLDIENDLTDEEMTALYNQLTEYYKKLADSDPKVKKLLDTLGVGSEQINEFFSSITDYSSKSKRAEEMQSLKTTLNSKLVELTESYSESDNANRFSVEYNAISSDGVNILGDISSNVTEQELNTMKKRVEKYCILADDLIEKLNSTLPEDMTINVLAQNEAQGSIIEKYFYEYAPDSIRGMNYRLSINYYTDDSFIQEAIMSNTNYDIVIGDADITSGLSEYGEMIYTLDGLGVNINESDYYAGALEQARNANGELIGMCYQFCPTVTLYRTDYAEQYFGIKTPEAMQSMLKSVPDQMNVVSDMLNTASNGSIKMFAGYENILSIYNAGKNSKWSRASALSMIGDDNLFAGADYNCLSTILSTIGALSNKGSIDISVFPFTDEWMNGLEEGVMFYTVPDWFVFHVLHDEYYDIENADKWAVCDGFNSYVWGGDYLVVPKSCDSTYAAKMLVEGICTDEDFIAATAIEQQFFPADISVAKQISANLNSMSEGREDDLYFNSEYYNTFLSAAQSAINENFGYTSERQFSMVIDAAIQAVVNGVDIQSAIENHFALKQ